MRSLQTENLQMQARSGLTSQGEVLLHESTNVELVGQARVHAHDGDAAALAR